MSKKNKRKSKSREPLEFDDPYDIEEVAPQPKTRYKTIMVYLLDQEEVNRLVEASSSDYVEPVGPHLDISYHTYTPEECLSLVSGYFHPRKSKRKK